MSAVADDSAAVNYAMRLQPHAIIQFNFVADDRVWTNVTAVANPGARADDGGGMNVIRFGGDSHRVDMRNRGKDGIRENRYFALSPFLFSNRRTAIGDDAHDVGVGDELAVDFRFATHALHCASRCATQ